MNILKYFWAAWKKFGQILGDLIARVFLTIFYFTFFLPFGIGVRIFGDPLAIKKNPSPKWVSKEQKNHNIAGARRLS